MRVHDLLPVLLLGACSPGSDDRAPPDAVGGLPCPGPNPGCTPEECDDGSCVDIDLWECDETTGEWVRTAICEGSVADVVGDYWLVQSITSADAGCPALSPRDPLTISVTQDWSVTAPSPIVIVDHEIGDGFDEPATIDVTLEDDWVGTAITAIYDLAVTGDGDVAGEATATLTGCEARLEITGALCPEGVQPCAVDEGGWHAWCDAGVVYADDLDRQALCLPDETDEQCAIGGVGNAAAVSTCTGACGDLALHALDDASYAAFDPQSLCE